jgi:hypothetical protein
VLKYLPFILFIGIVGGGLGAWFSYQYCYPRWQQWLTVGAQERLHLAIEKYYMEKLAYPPAFDDSGERAPFKEGVSIGKVPSYLVSMDNLPWRMDRKFKDIKYATDGEKRWILCYPGPDWKMETDLEYWVGPAEGQEEAYRQKYPEGLIQYDPTNGTPSRGDIIRWGP